MGFKKILLDSQKACNQLFVDISELVKKDAKTGIQRVVRNILHEWLSHPPKGYQVMPVYATEEEDYCYARCFTANFLGNSDQILVDEPIDYMIGDIFFILDLQPTVQINKRFYYEKLRRLGISVYFLVHDLLCVRMPQYFGSGASDNFSRWLDVVKENSGVICVSKATADDFIDWVNETTKHTVNTINVAWNHNGAEVIQRREKNEESEEISLLAKSLRYSPSFLMVGTLEPRKGHTQVLDAFERLWQDNIKVNLVIVGKQGWMMESFVERILAHPEVDKHLYWFGSITDTVLDEIYDKSSCLIAASYGEGFGLPLVESACHNLPIICRDISVFREIAADHAFYFSDDLKSETVSKAIRRWLELFKEDVHPKPKAIEWLTWADSASNMLEIIINKKWYASFKPDGALLLDKTYDHKSALLNFEYGWSHVEEFHRWTEGYKSILIFRFKGCETKFQDIIISCQTLGKQKIILLINGKKTYEKTLDSSEAELILEKINLKNIIS